MPQLVSQLALVPGQDKAICIQTLKRLTVGNQGLQHVASCSERGEKSNLQSWREGKAWEHERSFRKKKRKEVLKNKICIIHTRYINTYYT